MKKRLISGFTLIELLVVIGLIIILAAMLTPLLSRAVESGRTATCISNLRQLQLASINYASGNGHLPHAISTVQTDHLGAYYEQKGWLAWANYGGGSAQPGTANAYPQTGALAIKCVTNGTLYAHVRSDGIYMCPTFRKSYPTYTRGYSMNSNLSARAISAGGATASVLFGDDSGCTSTTADSKFGTNEVNKLLHSGGKKGNVVYLDGHTETW